MRWPWVSRKRLDEEIALRDKVMHLSDHQVLMARERDAMIFSLQTRVQALLGASDSPDRIAESLSSLNSEQQAQLLNALGRNIKGWGSEYKAEMQIFYILDDIDEDGKFCLRKIVECWSHKNPGEDES